MSGIDPRRYLLGEQESRAIFTADIVAGELGGAEPVDRPRVIFVAGQPGAGKTRTTQLVVDSLADQGGSVVVNSDYYKPYHPMYHRLLEQDDKTAAPYTSLDGRRWMAMAEEWLIEHRRNVVIETTMRDPGDFLEPAAMFRRAGYATGTAILAVPEAQSRLGILARYHDQVAEMGHGRLTETANHDASYRGVLAAAAAIDRDEAVDAVTVYRRGGAVVYDNARQPGGGWQRPARTVAVLTEERARTWTAEEARQFLAESSRIRRGLEPVLRQDLAAIAALAEPHLPPGVRAVSLTTDAFPGPARGPVRGASPTSPDRPEGRTEPGRPRGIRRRPPGPER